MNHYGYPLVDNVNKYVGVQIFKFWIAIFPLFVIFFKRYSFVVMTRCSNVEMIITERLE